MSYVEENLIDGEKIIYAVKINSAAWVPGFCIWLLVDFLFLYLYVSNNMDIGLLDTLAFIALGTFTYSVYMIPRTRELALTNKRVISKEGWIRVKTSELKISKLETVEIEQGILDKMFEAGTVVCIGTGGSRTSLRGVDNPLEFRKKFLEYTDKNAP